MSKLPLVFSDASISKSTTTLAVYSSNLAISYTISLPRVFSPNIAEELALKLAFTLTKGVNCHYFVDNKQVADKYPQANWIPRELNTAADTLSKQHTTFTPLGTTSIASFIQAKYTLNHKLRLIAAITGLEASITTLVKHTLAKRLLNVLLTRDERPSTFRATISKAKTLKQSELVGLLRVYQTRQLKA